MPSDHVLYEPVRYGGRSSAENARRSRSMKKRLCCGILICFALGAIALIFSFMIKTATVVWKKMNFLHDDLIIQQNDIFKGDSKAIEDLKPHFMYVTPLIKSSDPFNIRATVWLDVTQHLEQGFHLPKTADGNELEVISYHTDRNTTRTEVILYSDIVFNNFRAKDESQQFANVPISIPIDPLYTQDLGPSTLRITYSAEAQPETEQRMGKLVLLRSLFPFSSYILPRTKDSIRIQSGCDGSLSNHTNSSSIDWHDVTSLSRALEFNGASMSLLSLRISQQSILPNCTYEENLSIDPNVSSFLDNAPTKRSFTNKTILDRSGRRLILGENCTVLSPLLRTHSRLYMIPSDHTLDFTQYGTEQSQTRTSLRNCFPREGQQIPPECVQLMRMHGALENWLWFYKDVNGTKESDEIGKGLPAHTAYAPTLIQRELSTPPEHQRMIPRTRPNSTIGSESKDEARSRFWFLKSQKQKYKDLKQACKLPQLEPDRSNEFFNVNIQIRLGTIGAFRGSLNERHSISPPAMTLKEMENEDADIPAFNWLDEAYEWELYSYLAKDHYHPKRRSLLRMFTCFISELNQIISFLFLILYWYTRTTTAGLSLRAQLLQTNGLLVLIFVISYDIWTNGWGIESAVNVTLSILEVLTRSFALLRITIIYPQERQSWFALRLVQRPKSKAERRCERAEERLGWTLFFTILTIHGIFIILSQRQEILLTPGKGCILYHVEDDKDPVIREWIRLIAITSVSAGEFYQFYFNTISPALIGSSKLGSFAGQFKIQAYYVFFVKLFEQIVYRFEWIGGHSKRSYPISLSMVEGILLAGISFWQAINYPGIPQIQDEEDEDDQYGL